MIKNIAADSDLFFEKSVDFNSKVGGRFTPARSYGAIYSSSSPTLSMLEVLYHLFDSSLALYKNLKRSSDKLTSSFNVPVPEKIEVLIVALEFEILDSNSVFDICKDSRTFKKTCKDLGFYRYMGEGFDEDFIFGNDYEITNIMGCSFHKSNKAILKSPSARISLDHSSFGRNNIVIPENMIKKLQPKLTGRFREYVCTMNMNEEFGKHSISVKAIGVSEIAKQIFLQSSPSKSNGRIKSFSQINDSDRSQKKYIREVRLQRFVHD